jgi:hypothetical protein
LNLLFVGGETRENISVIEPAGDYVFVAAGHQVLGYLRGKQVLFKFTVTDVGAANARGRRTGHEVIAFVDDDAGYN